MRNYIGACLGLCELGLVVLLDSLTDYDRSRENDITDVIEETFSVQEERFGELVTIELKPGGADVPVTEENKAEFVEYVEDLHFWSVIYSFRS